MNKTILGIVLLIIILVGAYLVFGHKHSPGDGHEEAPAASVDAVIDGDRQVRGMVTRVDTDQVPVDGPALVTLSTDDGSVAIVAVPSMMMPQCAARNSIADPYQLTVGQTVEVRGAVGEEAYIIPCSSSAHYLRVAE